METAFSYDFGPYITKAHLIGGYERLFPAQPFHNKFPSMTAKFFTKRELRKIQVPKQSENNDPSLSSSIWSPSLPHCQLLAAIETKRGKILIKAHCLLWGAC